MLTSGSLKYPKVGGPGSGRSLILFRHDPCDLSKVIQVVYHPGSEQFRKSYCSESGMNAGAFQLFVGQVQFPNLQ